jgi:hypothetical protein
MEKFGSKKLLWTTLIARLDCLILNLGMKSTANTWDQTRHNLPVKGYPDFDLMAPKISGTFKGTFKPHQKT